MPASFLAAVMAERRADAARARRAVPLDALRRAAAAMQPARRLAPRLGDPAAGPALIAEFKRASPSAGRLRPDGDVAALAAAYQRAGAAAVSVLTEPRHFLGTDDDLRRVRAAVSLPVLRKDFVADPYQVFEARALGADLVLLIVAGLDDAALRALYETALEVGLEPLVEIHSPADLDRARPLERAILGVNSRDLNTLKTDLAVARALAPRLPPGRPAVAESGIRTRADVEALWALGYRGFLVGETLLRAGDPAAAAALLGRPPPGVAPA